MNNADLVIAVAAAHGISQKDAKKYVNTIVEKIGAALKRDEEVSLAGFGKFKVKALPSREGRNPATGQTMTIPAFRKVNFSAAKGLKDTLNG